MQTKVIGIVVPDFLDIIHDNDYFMVLVRHLESALAMGRCKALLFARSQDQNEVPGLSAWIRANDIAGIVNITTYNYAGVMAVCREAKIPCVQVDHYKQSDEDAYPTVRINNKGALRAAADHLLEFGHRRIGMITGLSENQASQQRLEGYQLALRQAGIAMEAELCCQGDGNFRSGHACAAKLLSLPNPPTAIIAFNDIAAEGVIAAIREQGLVPGRDVSVIGFDDMAIAQQCNPPLTTIRQPLEELATQLALMLMDLMAGYITERERIIETALIIRQSTGPAPCVATYGH